MFWFHMDIFGLLQFLSKLRFWSGLPFWTDYTLKKGFFIKVCKIWMCCVFCQQEMEDRDHVFIKRPFVASIWASIRHNLQISSMSEKLLEVCITWRESLVKKNAQLERNYSVMAVVWMVWNERNRRNFQQNIKIIFLC